MVSLSMRGFSAESYGGTDCGRVHSPVSGAVSSAQSSRLLSGARAESYDQIVDVTTPQIEDEIPEVFHSILQDCISERIVARIVDFPLPQIQRQMVKVVKITPQERVFGAGRRTDRRSGSAPDLRAQALLTVVHRPAESVLLRFTECFHPLSSSWDGTKIDNDRFGQDRELGRHESRHIKPQLDRIVLPSVQRAVVWGTLGVAVPAEYFPPGIVGLWPPATVLTREQAVS